MLELYIFAGSIPSRAVRLLLEEMGLEYKLHTLTLPQRMEPEFIKLNPFHAVPVLVDGEYVINESRSIMRYLVDKFGGTDNPLYPKDLRRRIDVDRRLDFDGTSLFTQIFAYLFNPLFKQPPEPTSPELEAVMCRQLEQLERILSGASQGSPGGRVDGGPYVCGAERTIADTSVMSSLTFLEVVDYDLQGKYPHVAKYVARMKQELPAWDKCSVGQVAWRDNVRTRAQK